MQISVQVVAFIITFVITLFLGPMLIPVLTRFKFGQTVRDDGPATHLKKMGTPTIGGLIFLIPVLIVSAFYAGAYPKLIPIALVTFGFGLIGFIDDFIKIKKRRQDGLYPKQKTVGLLLVAAIFTVYVAYFTDLGVDVSIPFVGTINEVWFFIPFTMFYLYCTTNSVNITDGLDGLCSGITLIVMVFFTILSMMNPEWKHTMVFSAILAGGCLGFLTFNIHPAKVFMGDTGSLALGGAVGAMAIMMKIPFLIFLFGIIYVVEMLSVGIQVISFKTTGKRVFKMAPIHHHFELKGWKETKVVYVFWTVTAVFCIIALYIGGI